MIYFTVLPEGERCVAMKASIAWIKEIEEALKSASCVKNPVFLHFMNPG